jgi:hypothetical protein
MSDEFEFFRTDSNNWNYDIMINNPGFDLFINNKKPHPFNYILCKYNSIIMLNEI